MSHPPQPSRTVTGRYRRAPAAWLWLALLLLPLLLALLSWFLFDRPESPQEPAPGAATSTSSPGQTPTSTETATSGTPAAAPAPIDIRSDEQELIVDAVVPDEAARANLLETAQAAAGDREVIDQITVTPGQPVTDPAGLSGLLDDATDRFQTLGIHLTPDEAVLTGSAPRQSDVSAVEEAARTAFPDRQVEARFAAEAPVPGATLSCGNLEQQIAARFDKDPVNFDLESSTVDEASTERVQDVAKALVACNSTGIKVNGHADATGPDALNRDLARARAEAVRDIMVEAGVKAENISAQGFGARRNVAPNDNPDAREKNRRVVILVGSENR